MRRYWPCIFLSLSVFLCACSSRTTSPSPSPEIVADSSQCKQLSKQQQLASVVRRDGIQVFQVGEEVMLVLPTHDFFSYNSTSLKNKSYEMRANTKTLDHVVAFINSYPTVNIQVTGYASEEGDEERNLTLSRIQAEKIRRYLWENGLDSRLISADAKFATDEHPRIEIFFRLPPPTNVFH